MSTASATSSSPASATSKSGSSVAGEIDPNHSFVRGSTSSPPMKRPYRSRIYTMSRASGAGAYSHSNVAGRLDARFSTWAISRS